MGELKRRGQVWWIRYYRDGRRYEESAGSDKKGDAERLLRIKEGAIARGMPITPNIDRVRFEELAADLLNDPQHPYTRQLLAAATRRTR